MAVKLRKGDISPWTQLLLELRTHLRTLHYKPYALNLNHGTSLLVFVGPSWNYLTLLISQVFFWIMARFVLNISSHKHYSSGNSQILLEWEESNPKILGQNLSVCSDVPVGLLDLAGGILKDPISFLASWLWLLMLPNTTFLPNSACGKKTRRRSFYSG